MIYDLESVKARYGLVPDESLTRNYIKAMKIIIGADGEVSKEEWQRLKQGMLRLNVPDYLIDEIEDFDVSTATLEELIPDLYKNKKQARLLIRDAIEIARADGTYAEEEKEAVRQAAQLVKVAPEAVALLESLVVMEHAIGHMRRTLLNK